MAVVINGNGSITGLDIHDSAATQAQINATDTHDSAAVQAQIDSAAVSITGTQTITGAKTFVGTTSTPAITLNANDNTADAAPIMEFVRQTAQANSADYLGQIKFRGEDSDGADEVYAKITGKIADPTNATEDGLIEYAVVSGGSNKILARMTGNSGGKFILENSTALEVTGDATVDGSLGIGTSSPAEQVNLVGTGGTAKVRFDGDTSNLQNNFIGITGYDDLIIASDEANTGTASTIQFRVDASERMRINASGDLLVGANTDYTSAKFTINTTPPTAFGSPMLQVGQETFTAGGYYSIGMGYANGSYSKPPVEIAAVTTSSSGGTTAELVFGTRSVTTDTAPTERMRIDASGNVGIGTDNPTEALHLSGSSAQLIKIENTDTSMTGDQVVGGIQFRVNDPSGSGVGDAGQIVMRSASSVGGQYYIQFNTSSASSLNQEMMRIHPSGGITFNGDTADGNRLNDYEEGTWTPVLATSNGDGTYSMTVQKATYRKIGNIVFYSAYMSAVTCTVQGTGNMRITGLPYTASTEGNSYSGGVTIYGSMTAHTRGQITAPGYSYLRLIHREAVTAGEFDMTAAELGTNANFGSWIFQGNFYTD